MSLVRYEPVNLFSQFNNEINRFFNSEQEAANRPARDWQPAVDIREEDNRYLILADIPGIERKDIEITLEDGVLSIKGERTREPDEKQEGYRRKERVHGTFLRQFTLPDTVDTTNISASVKDGVLEVGIPKQEKPEARKIAVN